LGEDNIRHVLMIAAALALVATAPSYAQKIDKNGRCHDAAGKFTKADVCKGTGGSKDPAATPAAVPKAPYKLDAKGKCHDVKGKMAPKAKCAA
jgi:hypothetical protein